VIFDEFRDNRHNWVVQDTTEAYLGFDNGYVIEHRKNHGAWLTCQNLDIGSSQRWSVWASIQFIAGTTESFYGVVWDVVGGGNFSFFNLSASGNYSIGKLINGSSNGNPAEPILSYKSPTRCHVEEINSLIVESDGQRAWARINGYEVSEWAPDKVHSHSAIGLIAGPSTKIRVLKFSVTQENERESIAILDSVPPDEFSDGTVE
jgi:hypothetical protein